MNPYGNKIEDVDIDKLQAALKPRLTKYIPWDPTPKQTAFLLMNHVKEMLYGGAAGGGKSVVQLMAALQYVDVPKYSAVLIRKTYADLAQPGALLDMAKEWLMPFVEKGEVKYSDKDKKFTFPSGATLKLGYLEHENDKYQYQGAEYQYIGFDEVTQIVPAGYRYLFSRLRKKKTMNVPLRMRATANPGGEYHEYYKERFFDEEGKKKGRVFIGAKLDDNPYLDADAYRESLDELDEVEKARLLDGDWDILEKGDMFETDWFIEVAASEIPVKAKRVRFWDMASTDPKKRNKKNKRNQKDPDYTVGLLLAEYRGIFWIEDIVRARGKPHVIEDIVEETAERDGKKVVARMEQEPGSSGDYTIDSFARGAYKGYNFDGVRSSGSKTERAEPVSKAAKRGHIMISSHCRNKRELLHEAKLFPFGTHDDIIDALSGAFKELTDKKRASTAPPVGISGSYGYKESYWAEA